MNIFYTSMSPMVAAHELCDKHICQMIRETAQLLSTAHRVLDGHQVLEGKKKRFKLESLLDIQIPQATHHNHPCAVWVQSSNLHYYWLKNYFGWILTEYTNRYHKIHFYQQFDGHLRNLPKAIPEREVFEEPPQCMPEEYKAPGDCVQAYRNYYIGAKARFAKWNHSNVPNWWPNQNGNGFILKDG